MCLTKIDEVLKPIDWSEREGWKVFQRHEEGYGFEFRNLNQAFHVPTDCWLKAKVISISSNNLDTYRSGFHVFVTRRGADEWHGNAERGCVVVKVRVRGVETIGSQGEHECWVAREMWVPRPK